MSEQIIGYYNAHETKLLNSLDKICLSMKKFVATKYSEKFASDLQTDIHAEYKKLISDIPYIKGNRAKFLNLFLIITAQELAVYKAMKKHGKSASEAWELCHHTIKKQMQTFPKWKRWFFRYIMFSAFVKKIIAKREKNHQKGNFGDFNIEYIIGKNENFDIGVNYHGCGNYNFVMKHGGAEFAPFICMSDIALSDALGWGLTRTQTLADGCSYCDFRFKKGAPTNISSKIPEVEQVIKNIRKNEIN